MPNRERFSKNNRINLVVENIVDQLCPFLEEQAREISEMTAIGKALGTGKDISRLLKMILSIARRFTKADGGTLYLVDNTNQFLEFHVIQNDTLKIKQEGDQIDLRPLKLYTPDGEKNLANVSSYVFHTGEIVNIKDVYETEKFHFEGMKKFDKAFNYHAQSMVVIPMRNHEDDIIGILQLINARNQNNENVPFETEAQDKAVALASQAAVILTQQMLILEMKELFEAFIRAIAVSIDEKSKHTGGHIHRVTDLALMIAEQVNQDDTIYKRCLLSKNQIDELRIAALMHDTGKITTPDHIIDKASKLETVFDRIELVKTRWELFKTHVKLKAAEKKLDLLNKNSHMAALEAVDQDCRQRVRELEKEFEIIAFINSNQAFMDKEKTDCLEEITKKSHRIGNKEIPCLTRDEFDNLSIPKGTLNDEEREIINSHAWVTQKILSKLPWPKKLANIPSIAGAHHEKLNGTGYPLQLSGEDLNLQARILAVADIFEALSAPDRPYKKPMPLSKTVSILTAMADNNEIDKDLVQLIIRTATHVQYAKKHLSASQIDV